MFDGTFKSVTVPGGFVDPRLPKSFAPFGIQAIGGDIYVTYAKQEQPGSDEEETGAGLGKLRGADNRALRVEGLWGLQFGNGVSGQETNSLFWAAGPNDETDGAYGVTDAVTK